MREATILGRHVIVKGLRRIKIDSLDELFDQIRDQAEGCHIQLFDARLIAGFDHLYFSVLNALKAHDGGTGISRNLAVETLLYASGQHQISRAIELLGLKPGSSEVAVLIIAGTREQAVRALGRIEGLLQGEESEDVIELTDGKIGLIRKTFEIGDLEIEATLRDSRKEAITSLLIERVALLATES